MKTSRHHQCDEIPCQTLSVIEAGKVLGVSHCTAYKLVKSGMIPVIRLGRKMRVSKYAMDDLLLTRQNEA